MKNKTAAGGGEDGKAAVSKEARKSHRPAVGNVGIADPSRWRVDRRVRNTGCHRVRHWWFGDDFSFIGWDRHLYGRIKFVGDRPS